MSSQLPPKVLNQVLQAGLPTGGQHPFDPKLVTNRQGEQIIQKKAVGKGPKRGKRGYVDTCDRIWIKDRAHARVPDHWDVQIDDGDDYIRIDMNGNELP